MKTVSIIAGAWLVTLLAGASALAQEPEGGSVPSKVQAILRTNCYRCHGQDGSIEGGFNFVLDPSSPYLMEAEGDHYEETNSIGPYAEEQLNHPMMELARWRAP